MFILTPCMHYYIVVNLKDGYLPFLNQADFRYFQISSVVSFNPPKMSFSRLNKSRNKPQLCIVGMLN
jgi:hypothetical protein